MCMYPGVQATQPYSSGYLCDFCDGEIYKAHPIFSTDSHVIQIIIYYDDVEVANPLGSHRGVHKLGKGLCAPCMYLYYLYFVFYIHYILYIALFYY